MKKTAKYLTIMAVICLLLSGCGKKTDEGDTPSDTNATIKVGVNMELSGGVASYGQAELSGIELAVKQANANGGILGRQIELVKIDNTSESSEATSAATKLATQENVTAILGPATSGNFKATLPVASEYGVAVISPSATDDKVLLDDTSNTVYSAGFRICFKDSFQGVTMANFAYSNLEKTKAVIYSDSSSDYAQGLAQNFKDQFIANGGAIVGEESYLKNDTDFNALLTKLKGVDFDVMFIPGYYGEAGQIIKQARDLGITVPIIGADGFESDKLAELAGAENMYDIYYSTHYTTIGDDEVVAKFVADYKAEYGTEANAFAAMGYDTANMLFDAITRAGSDDPAKVLEALATTDGFVGVCGTVSVDENHDAVKSIFVVKMEGESAVDSLKVNP